MKKIVLALVLVAFAAACGPSKGEWEAALKEIDDLKAQLADLKAKDEARISELETENQQLKDAIAKLQGEKFDLETLVTKLEEAENAAKKRLETFEKMLEQFKSLIDAGKETLAEVAGVLAQIPDREFQVAGHTDNVPIKGGAFKDNWELSTARAVSVVSFLQANGVQATALSAAGYSEFQPEAENTTEDGKAMNRRIEIILMPNLSELPNMSDLEKMLK